MSQSAPPTVAAAHTVLFATYSAPPISLPALDRWRQAGPADEIRRVNQVDSFSRLRPVRS